MNRTNLCIPYISIISCINFYEIYRKTCNNNYNAFLLHDILYEKYFNNNMLQSSKVCESESVFNKNEYIKKKQTYLICLQFFQNNKLPQMLRNCYKILFFFKYCIQWIFSLEVLKKYFDSEILKDILMSLWLVIETKMEPNFLRIKLIFPSKKLYRTDSLLNKYRKSSFIKI
jgi:hypothetical protein